MIPASSRRFSSSLADVVRGSSRLERVEFPQEMDSSQSMTDVRSDGTFGTSAVKLTRIEVNMMAACHAGPAGRGHVVIGCGVSLCTVNILSHDRVSGDVSSAVLQQRFSIRIYRCRREESRHRQPG